MSHKEVQQSPRPLGVHDSSASPSFLITGSTPIVSSSFQLSTKLGHLLGTMALYRLSLG